MQDKTPLILGVALITWGGVFFYLLRLDAALKKLEKQIPEPANEALSPLAEP